MNQSSNINIFKDATAATLKVQEFMRRMYPNAAAIQENDMPNPFEPFVTMGNHVFVGDFDVWENITRFTVAYYTPNFKGDVFNVEYCKVVGFPILETNDVLSQQAIDWLHQQMREVSIDPISSAECTVRLMGLSNAIRMIAEEGMHVTEIISDKADEYTVVLATNSKFLEAVRSAMGEENISELYVMTYRF